MYSLNRFCRCILLYSSCRSDFNLTPARTRQAVSHTLWSMRYVCCSTQMSCLLHFKTCAWYKHKAISRPHNQIVFWCGSWVMNGLRSGQPQPFIRHSNESKAFPSPSCGGDVTVRHKFDKCSSLVLLCYNLIRRYRIKVKLWSRYICYFTSWGKIRGQQTK